MEPIKPGYKSTEFYVTLLVIGLAAAFGAPPATPWQARLGLFFGAVATALVYKFTRTAQKGAHLDVVAALAEAAPPPGDSVSANGGGIAGTESGPRVVGFRVLPLLLLAALSLSSCAWLKTEAPLVASDVIHCASDGAIAAAGPLAQTLADAALHGGEADWAGELVKLEGSAKEFRDCVILAALHRLSDPIRAPVTESPAALVRFRAPRAEPAAAAQIEQAKLRLRAALRGG